MPRQFPMPFFVDIARRLFKFIEEDGENRELSVFLCGGAGKREAPLRQAIADHVPRSRSKFTYKAHFPEHLFMDVLHGHHKTDLLGLESNLAKSVHVVAILLNSAGAIAELGAFANHPQLRRKLLVFADTKYKRTPSFINLGPLRLLERQNPGVVRYLPLTLASTQIIADDIRGFARHISNIPDLSPSTNLDNPIQAYHFILALLYVLPPISPDLLRQLAADVSCLALDAVSIVVDAATGTLVRDGYVTRSPNGLTTTQHATRCLFPKHESWVVLAKRADILHRLRLKALNRFLRKRNRVRGGEAATWPALTSLNSDALFQT